MTRQWPYYISTEVRPLPYVTSDTIFWAVYIEIHCRMKCRKNILGRNYLHIPGWKNFKCEHYICIENSSLMQCKYIPTRTNLKIHKSNLIMLDIDLFRVTFHGRALTLIGQVRGLQSLNCRSYISINT